MYTLHWNKEIHTYIHIAYEKGMLPQDIASRGWKRYIQYIFIWTWYTPPPPPWTYGGLLKRYTQYIFHVKNVLPYRITALWKRYTQHIFHMKKVFPQDIEKIENRKNVTSQMQENNIKGYFRGPKAGAYPGFSEGAGVPRSAKEANTPNKRASELTPRTWIVCAHQGSMFRPY